MKYSYASEVFDRAIRTLATTDLPLRERLKQAISDLSPLDAEHLPEDLRNDFLELHDRITREPNTTGEGTVPSTISKMSDKEVGDVASKIVEIHFAIEFARHTEK